jgi:hypothetical protein
MRGKVDTGAGVKKQNLDLAEPPGAFVGAAADRSIAGAPPRKSPGSQKVKNPPNFFASGESEATSLKAARMPTHWRRGGFVRYQDGGGVKQGPPEPPDRDKPTNLKRGGTLKRGGPVEHDEADYTRATAVGDPMASADRAQDKTYGSRKRSSFQEAAEQESGGYGSRGFPPRYAKGGWMKSAVKNPGALHRQLGVPQGQKIPAAKIEKAAHSDNPTLRKRANLAKTFAKFRPK